MSQPLGKNLCPFCAPVCVIMFTVLFFLLVNWLGDGNRFAFLLAGVLVAYKAFMWGRSGA